MLLLHYGTLVAIIQPYFLWTVLAAVKPSYGVGIDPDPALVELARKKFPHLHFSTGDPHELELDEHFDYILICNSLGDWHDIQQVFERIRPLTKRSTRIVITYYNYLWEGVLRLASFLRFRRPRSYENWLPPEEIANLLNLTGQTKP